MDHVQLADTPHGRGCHKMSDTDTRNVLSPPERPSALGDLRFAGTIAAGFIAGTLGLGAVAAPLVGWKDWPAGLEKEATTQTVQLAAPRAAQPPHTTPRDGSNPAPVSVAAQTAIGGPGADGTGTGTGVGTGGLASIIDPTTSAVSTPVSEAVKASVPATSTASESDGSGTWTGAAGFAQPDMADAD